MSEPTKEDFESAFEELYSIIMEKAPARSVEGYVMKSVEEVRKKHSETIAELARGEVLLAHAAKEASGRRLGDNPATENRAKFLKL